VLAGDIILNIGDQTDKIYMIFHGDVEGINIETKKYVRLSPGDFFGGHIPLLKIDVQYKAV
jgi:hypothetical protein